MARSISAESLKEGSIIKVDGTISYSHVTSLIEGAALTKRVAQQRQRGSRYPTTVPHTSISIVDPVIHGSGANGALTREEQFVQDGAYPAGEKSQDAGHLVLGLDNKGAQLPIVMEVQADGTFVQVQPGGELAKGLQVTLVLNVFKPRDYEKRGIGIQAVLVNEPIRTFGNGPAAVADALAKLGITVSGGITAPVAIGQAPMSFEEAQAAADQLSMPGVFEPTASQAVAASIATPVVEPSAAVESPDDHIARLTAQLAAAQAAAAKPLASPWDVPVEV